MWPWSFELAILNLSFFLSTSEMAWRPMRHARKWPKGRGSSPRHLLQPKNFKPKSLLFSFISWMISFEGLKFLLRSTQICSINNIYAFKYKWELKWQFSALFIKTSGNYMYLIKLISKVLWGKGKSKNIYSLTVFFSLHIS